MGGTKSWRTGVSLALVGIVGAWLGSAVQHFLSLERERSTAFEERQNSAYVAFLSAFEKYRVATEEEQRGNRDQAAALLREYQLEAGVASRRIAVFGDRQVVEAMAAWHRSYEQGGLPGCDQQSSTELALWVGMRRALLSGDQAVSSRDLAAITTRCNPAAGQ